MYVGELAFTSASVRRVVLLGVMVVDSMPGAGACAATRLPIAKSPPAAGAAPSGVTGAWYTPGVGAAAAAAAARPLAKPPPAASAVALPVFSAAAAHARRCAKL